VKYSGGQFNLSMTNVTTGKTVSEVGTVPGAIRSSAEWIAEAPLSTPTLKPLPLAPFGAGYFGDDYTGAVGTCYAADSKTSGPISSFGDNVQQIGMVNGDGVPMATPSALSADGSSFSVVSTAINVTNAYGLPGQFDLYILDSSLQQIWYDQIKIGTSNGSTNEFLTGLSLTPGQTYTFWIETYGTSGFGPGFSNFVLTTSPDLQFSNGTDTFSGLIYAGQGGSQVLFTKLD
jgi:hypothetical protein